MIEIREINPDVTIGILDLKVYAERQNLAVKRDIERAGTRELLKNLLGTPDFELCYTPENKPYLKNLSLHISISHSHEKLVVICNKKANTGIDIELLRDKVRNIQHKYLSEREIRFAANDPDRLVTLWAAKEALYKVYGLKEVEFIKNLFIEEYSGAEINGRIEIKNINKSYKLIHEKIDDYKMVYVLHEIH
ncbi:MAG: 4'-phosphopantetheinyl transferase superfamily protein [Bacteroidia bacterium]|nr:4'-phosphopantetheinyl transferase superfamily protein [Bacteroidia bacterium]